MLTDDRYYYCCPDCGHTFGQPELEAHKFVGEPNWLNCPRCEIGQDKANWIKYTSEAINKRGPKC